MRCNPREGKNVELENQPLELGSMLNFREVRVFLFRCSEGGDAFFHPIILFSWGFLSTFREVFQDGYQYMCKHTPMAIARVFWPPFTWLCYEKIRGNDKKHAVKTLGTVVTWKIHQTLVQPDPMGSMYGIFTYIYHKNQPNVGEYTIHGPYGDGTGNLFWWDGWFSVAQTDMAVSMDRICEQKLLASNFLYESNSAPYW